MGNAKRGPFSELEGRATTKKITSSGELGLTVYYMVAHSFKYAPFTTTPHSFPLVITANCKFAGKVSI